MATAIYVLLFITYRSDPIFFAGEQDEFEDTVQPSDNGEFCCRLLKHLFLTRTGFYLKQ